MIRIHHLNESRSQRIVWLLEELGVPYEVVPYTRDPLTRLAPEALKEVHPLGKSPVIQTDGETISESGAIVEYLCERFAEGRLGRPAGLPERAEYLEWLHYAEGSAMLPLLLHMYVARLGEAGAPLHPRIEGEIKNTLSFIDARLEGRKTFLASGFSGADVQMSFVADVAKAFGLLAGYPRFEGWRNRMYARPAWSRALETGGPYLLGG